MSLGEHLDEARRRLMISVIAMGVCVLGMLFFKNGVTAIYLQPYQEMWNKIYADWYAEKEAAFAAAPGPASLQERMAIMQFLDAGQIDGRANWQRIVAGEHSDEGEAQQKSGFAGDWVNKGQPGREAFAAAFERHAQALVAQRDLLEQLAWHRVRKDQILNGTFPHSHLITSKGGFPLKRNLVSAGPLEDFWVFMAASMIFALMIASPVVLYQAWAFIAAGLYERERRVVYKVLPFSLALMIAGVCFCYFVMVPFGFYFLATMMDWELVGPMFTVALYFKFLFTLTVALALVFQLPLVMVALQKIGILRFATMAKNWRWVVMGMFVLSAILTPPDPVTQSLMVAPMLCLFLLGLFLMWRGRHGEAPMPAADEAAAEASNPGGR